MFIGRERELASLECLYKSDKFEFAVVYGRRRVGKTALISRFIEEKKAIYLMGVESSEKQNLEKFQQKHPGVWNRNADGYCVSVISSSVGVCLHPGRKGADYSGD